MYWSALSEDSALDLRPLAPAFILFIMWRSLDKRRAPRRGEGAPSIVFPGAEEASSSEPLSLIEAHTVVDQESGGTT